MKWTPEMLNNLGKTTDAEFGKKYGIKEKTVAQRRRRMGIAAASNRSNKVEITKEIEWHLGLMHDKDVAKKFGMTFHQVFHARRARGIQSFKAYCSKLNTCPDAPFNTAAHREANAKLCETVGLPIDIDVCMGLKKT